MEALTPREIQTRIRSGEALADVVKIAGLSADRVEAFAAPVLAERDHIAALALASPVRRAGEPGSGRGLRQVVAERLLSRGLDIDLVAWDAWRRSDGRWIAEGRYQSGGAKHVARFLFDNRGRFSLAENDEARWLIGDPSPSRGPQPGRRRGDDSEPTVDLAEREAASEVRSPDPAPAEDDVDWGPSALWAQLQNRPHVTPSWVDVPPETLERMEQDEDTLEPGRRSVLDTLYDMISVIEEDSVKIYRGLREPLPGLDDVGYPPPPEPPPEPPAPEADPADSDKIVPLASPRRRSSKRSRASVPSWDEIMFGGGPPNQAS
ncbi:MAG: DUF3071 domain-containing protein [Propionibacteriaceae bacterium]|jgi:hypothetical protein|nr:DUF3071 domain-containing protein [Propionibacteriaceae bacterium]